MGATLEREVRMSDLIQDMTIIKLNRPSRPAPKDEIDEIVASNVSVEVYHSGSEVQLYIARLPGEYQRVFNFAASDQKGPGLELSYEPEGDVYSVGYCEILKPFTLKEFHRCNIHVEQMEPFFYWFCVYQDATSHTFGVALPKTPRMPRDRYLKFKETDMSVRRYACQLKSN